jgi:hypothetical protein
LFVFAPTLSVCYAVKMAAVQSSQVCVRNFFSFEVCSSPEVRFLPHRKRFVSISKTKY